jgi:tetratricopeptide (TPR) repeat protein
MRPKLYLALSLLLILTAGILSIVAAGCEVGAQDEAEQSFRSALEKNPGNMEARMGLARVLVEREARSKAMAVLREGANIDSTNAPLWKVLEEVCWAWGREPRDPNIFEIAKCSLNELVDAGAAGAETFKQLGYVQKRSGRHDKSIDSFTVAARLDPSDMINQGRLGYAYAATGRYEKGLPLLSEATERRPDSHLLWWWLGDTQRLLGDYKAATTNLDTARRLAPQDDHAELDKAVTFTRKLLLKGKGSAGWFSHIKLAERHRELGRPDRVIAEYEAALELLPPEKADAIGLCYSNIGLCYARVNKLEMALAHVERAIEAHKRGNNHLSLLYDYGHLSYIYNKLANRARERKAEFREKAVTAATAEEYHARKAGHGDTATRALIGLCWKAAYAYGVDDPRVQEYRKRMQQYVPKKGPVTTYTAGEAGRCEAELRRLEKDYARAKQLLEMVAPYYGATKKWGEMLKAPHVYNQLSYLCWKEGGLDEAMSYAEQCVAKLSEIRSVAGTDEFKTRIAGPEWRYAFSSLLLPLAVRKGHGASAVEYSEQYKGRALMDLLGSKAAAAKQRAFERTRMERGIVLARVEDVERQVAEASASGDRDNLRSLQRTLSTRVHKYGHIL